MISVRRWRGIESGFGGLHAGSSPPAAIRGKPWELKEATPATFCGNRWIDRFGYVYRYPGNEIHYVNYSLE